MAPGVPSSHYHEVPRSISFSGSGFLATYQLGVAQCFQNYAPWILRTAPCVLGASAGSLVAAAVVCEMNMITIRDEMVKFAKHMKAFTLGPLNPSINVFHWLEYILRKYLPSDAHQRATGRLAVAMTRLTDGKHFVMSEFQSREDVVQALLCSCFVPGYCGLLPPVFKGVHYMDGGFTAMQPVPAVSSSRTLTVCPFSGETDICPADTQSMLDLVVSGATLKGNMANSFRIFNALYPMALETLEQAFQSGYKDAIHFLLSNDLVPYLLAHKVSQEELNCNQMNALMDLETREDEEERKVEKDITTLTSFTDDNGSTEVDNCTEQEPTRYQPIREPLLQFDGAKDVPLSNVVTYLSMLQPPVRILSYLLLPLILLFNIILRGKHRLKLLFREAPVLAFWTWHGLRHFTFFFYSAFVCSLKKNISDRVTPIILLFQWLKVQAHDDEAPREQKHYSRSDNPSNAKDVRRESLQNPSLDYKKQK